MFKSTNENQWAWYQAQIIEDKKEKHEFMRDLAEYNAMFFNPEGVQEVRDARDNTYTVPDKDFGYMVKEMFGRELPESEREEMDPRELLKQQEREKLNPYLNMDLDEIKFTPM
jgi:hypothetical protein